MPPVTMPLEEGVGARALAETLLSLTSPRSTAPCDRPRGTETTLHLSATFATTWEAGPATRLTDGGAEVQGRRGGRRTEPGRSAQSREPGSAASLIPLALERPTWGSGGAGGVWRPCCLP